LISGAAWVFATRYDKLLPGGVGVENELTLASAANRGRNFNNTIDRATRAIEWAPVKWQPYFLRAIAKVGAKHPPADALADFRRARFLEPNVYEIPYEEGIVWLTTEPNLAITAWREALRRARPQRGEVYGRMLALATQYSPRVHQSLEEFGMVHHDLAIVFLEHTGGAPFMTALRRFFEHDPALQTLSNEEKTKFFAYWAERGDAAELVREIETHPEWMNHAWRGVAKYHAQQKNFRKAFEASRRFEEPPVLPADAQGSSIDQLRQALHASPENYGIGFQLYREQMRAGKIDEALVTARHFTEQSSCPAYFHFLEADGWAAKEDWERAWKALQKFKSVRK
jgi:hypothetical protein